MPEVTADGGPIGDAAGTPGAEGPSATPQPAGDLARVAAELVDVSHRLDEARTRAEALDGRELVAWVSKNLHAPLATIRAMAEALEDGVLPDPGTVDRYHRVHPDRGGATHQARRRALRAEPSDEPRPAARSGHAELGELVDFEVAAGATLGRPRDVRVEADVDPDATAARSRRVTWLASCRT